MLDNTNYVLNKNAVMLISNYNCKLAREVAKLEDSPIELMCYQNNLAMIAKRKIHLIINDFMINIEGHKTCSNVVCIRDSKFPVDGDIVNIHCERLKLYPKTGHDVIGVVKCYTHNGLILMGSKEKASKIKEENDLITVDVLLIKRIIT